MLPLSTLLATIDLADREYWLGHCEGFSVRSGGRRRGVVQSVERGINSRRPAALHICTGVVRLRELAVAVEDVEGVDPRRKTLWLRTRDRGPRTRLEAVGAWLSQATMRARVAGQR